MSRSPVPSPATARCNMLHSAAIRPALFAALVVIGVLPFTTGCSNSGGGDSGDVTIDVNPPGATLDANFGGGTGVAFLAAGEGRAVSVVEDSSGRLIVAGEVADASDNVQIGVWRLLDDGTLDTTFNGGTGVRLFDPSPTVTPDENAVAGLVIDNAGRIVVAGTAGDATDTDVFVARLFDSGQPDLTFGTAGGIVTGGNDGTTLHHDIATGVVVDAATRIVVTGVSSEIGVPGTSEAAASRFLTIGLADPNWDGDGLFLSGGSVDRANEPFVDGSGNAVLVGSSGDALALWSLNSDGTLDTGFGSGGVATLGAPGGGALVPVRSRLYDSVSVVVTGTRTATGEADRLFVARVFGDGTFDTSFASTGVATIGTSLGDSGGNALVVAPNGQVVASGATTLDDGSSGTTAAGGLWLLFSDGTLDASLAGTGHVHLSAALDAPSDAHGVLIDSSSRVVVVGAADTGAGTFAPIVWRVP